MLRKGYTLIEILIVISIFGIVGIVGISTFFNSFRISQRSVIENAILDDAKFILTSIANEIQTGSIDFEEYFNQCVIGVSCPNQDLSEFDFSDPDVTSFGDNHGYYSWQFKYGGEQDNSPDPATHGVGTTCQEDLVTFWEYPDDRCVTGSLVFSEDVDTGQNPHSEDEDNLPEDATALCTNGEFQEFLSPIGTDLGFVDSKNDCSSFDFDDIGSYVVNELYLLNADGNRKTILGLETINSAGDKALSKLEMTRQNQIIKVTNGGEETVPLLGFACADGYICTTDNTDNPVDNDLEAPQDFSDIEELDPKVPLRSELYEYDEAGEENIFNDFVPVSPLRVNVKNLKFIISPVEDPRRAFTEDNPSIQTQPQITIFLELEPSVAFRLPFISDRFNLKLQTTVSSGVVNEIPIATDQS